MSNKKIFSSLAVALFSLNLFWGVQAYRYQDEAKSTYAEAFQSFRLFLSTISHLRRSYVDETKVGYKDLVYAALHGMMDSLDKNSRFHEPEESREIEQDTAGTFGGIGVYIVGDDKGLKLRKLISGAPAEKAGLQKHDVITHVSGQEIAGLSRAKAISYLKGEEGSDVKVSIFRSSEKKSFDYTLTREKVQVPSVSNIRSFGDVGYLHLEQFNDPAAGEFEKAVLSLREKDKIKGLIIDLRQNPGGLLSSAVEICSHFLREGQEVLYTKGREDILLNRYRAKKKVQFDDLAVVVLLDKNSASAAEIVASCLRDYKIASLVGEKSYGKGSVQTILGMNEGSSIRFTIARYFTSSGVLIDGKGLEVDHEVKVAKKDRQPLYDALLYEEIDVEKDAPLKEALRVVNEKIGK